MSLPVLKTKLYMPAARPVFIQRSRLLDRLDTGLQRGCKLTLVSAPAGYGKTTLLASWIAHADLRARVAWLSLDAGDNDPVRFWAYVVAALQTVDRDIGGAALAMLQSPNPPPIASVLTTLINEVAALSGSDHKGGGNHKGYPYMLVLDDYHLITARPIHDGMTFLLDHGPPNLHLVIATRADPPLPIAHLRGRGQVLEVRQRDLRFTEEETAVFFKNVMGFDLAMKEVAALEARTEGWIAGLQMASLALQGQFERQGDKTAANFIRTFTGSDRYIIDYLMEEVLQRQPAHIQTFLLQTAMLDRLTAPLCDAILDKETLAQGRDVSSQALLEHLEHNNLFVVPLDNERRWYRYHRLFADLLRQRLRQKHSDLVPTLHLRASVWHADNGLMVKAIDHALAAKAYARAADLIAQEAEVTLMHSQTATMLNWIAALPEAVVRAHPVLFSFHAWALLWGGFPLDDVQARLQQIDKRTDLPPGTLAALRGTIAVFQGQLDNAVALFRQALSQLPEADVLFRSTATWVLRVAELVSGGPQADTQALDEIIRISQQAGNLMVTVQAVCYLAKLTMQRGQLGKAQTMYQRALALATTASGQRLPIASEALTGLGKVLYAWDALQEATLHLEESIMLSQQWSQTAAFDAYILLAQVRWARGNTAGVQDAIHQARHIASKTDAFKGDDLWVALVQGRLWITQGNLKAATRWAKERGFMPSTSLRQTGTTEQQQAGGDPAAADGDNFFSAHLRKYEHLVLARLWIALEQSEKALTLLRSLLPKIEAQGRVDLMIEIQILKALAFQAQGALEQALTALGHALSLAEPGDFVRVFVDEGQPLAQLLYMAAERGIAPAYTGKLLAAFPSSEAAPPVSLEETGGTLIEPLSARELDVLRLIAEGLSNKEIAQQLFLAHSTVKWHTRNIYGKLIVKNRTEAVAKARQLGILPIS